MAPCLMRRHEDLGWDSPALWRPGTGELLVLAVHQPRSRGQGGPRLKGISWRVIT